MALIKKSYESEADQANAYERFCVSEAGSQLCDPHKMMELVSKLT
jgi:hypothetical protein